MPSTKRPSTRAATSIATAAERTRSVIENLQSKLTEVSKHGAGARFSSVLMEERETVAEHMSDPPMRLETETEAELERQLEAYFARGGEKESADPRPAAQNRTLDDLRKRVVDGVVKRILEDWSNDGPGASSPLKDEVLERLIDRVFREFQTGSAESGDIPSR